MICPYGSYDTAKNGRFDNKDIVGTHFALISNNDNQYLYGRKFKMDRRRSCGFHKNRNPKVETDVSIYR